MKRSTMVFWSRQITSKSIAIREYYNVILRIALAYYPKEMAVMYVLTYCGESENGEIHTTEKQFDDSFFDVYRKQLSDLDD